MTANRFGIRCNIYLATLIQVVIVLFLFWLMRWVFYWCNSSLFGDMPFSHLWRLARAGIRFDVCVVAWFNVLFLFLRFLPFDFVYNRRYLIVTDIVYVVGNSVLLLLNLIDIPLYPIFGFRTSLTSLRTFVTEPNILGLTLSFVGRYIWVFLGALAIVLVLIAVTKVFVPTRPETEKKTVAWRHYAGKVAIFVIAGFITFVGIWGRGINLEPLYVEYALLHTKKFSEVNIVLNTPFTIIRMDDDFRLPRFEFFSDDKLSGIRQSLKTPDPGTQPNHKNLVILTIESGGTLWHKDLNVVGTPPVEGLTPFIDSLINQSLVFKNTMATSTVTVDGVRNIYAGYPAYGFFMISDVAFSNNDTEGLAALLDKIGYSSKFYYGGHKDSFNFYPFFKESGFQSVTYKEILPTSGEGSDKLWGYWDHELAEWAVKDLNKIKEPFFAGMLTLNPHDPFKIPDDWRENEYISGKDTPERAVEYLDKTLQVFFNEASKQKWYVNTIFIITADHGARYKLKEKWGTSYIQPHILFMIFDPSGELTREIRDMPVGQIDIMPTALSLLNYPAPYLAFGESVFTPGRQNYAFSVIRDKYQITGERYLIVLDNRMTEIEEVYDITADKELKHPLMDYDREETGKMLMWGQALMQDFTQRMYGNRMVGPTDSSGK